MNKHLLVTISHNPSFFYAVRFINSFFGHKRDLEVTLLSIAPNPSQDLGPDQPLPDPEAKRLGQVYQERGQAALHQAAKMLVANGFDPDAIKSSLIFRSISTPSDIATQANKGMYDAVLLGRRGLSLLESLFEQRISAGVLKQEISCPLWFCRPPLDQSKGVLLCVDGSRQALGMADHIGFMLEDEPEHEIVIMYVSKDPQDQGQTEIAKAKAELTANNIPESRIRFVTNCKRRPWQAILGQIKAGNYAAVCLGRKGLGHSGPSSAPLGVTTSKLLKSISNFSMWIYNA